MRRVDRMMPAESPAESMCLYQGKTPLHFFCLRTAVANGRGCKEVKLEQSTVIVPTLLI